MEMGKNSCYSDSPNYSNLANIGIVYNNSRPPDFGSVMVGFKKLLETYDLLDF